MRQVLITTLLILIAVSGFAKKKRASEDSCNSHELKTKGCHLKTKKYHIQLWQDKIFINDGVHRKIHKMPYAGEDVEWVRAKFSVVSGRPLLQVLIWNPSEGEGKVQSLMWHVYELQAVEMVQKIVKSVQRRLPNHTEEKKKFNDEPKAKFGLTPLKDKSIRWYVNKRKGKI